MVTGLDTSDETFFQLTLSEEELEIPLYQRYYKWKPDLIRPLWSDLFEVARTEVKHPTLFLGPMVLHDEEIGGDEPTYLVDGQQRLVTLSLFVTETLHRLREFDKTHPRSKKMGGVVNNLGMFLFQNIGEDFVEDDLDPLDLRFKLHRRDRSLFEEFVKHHTTSGPKTYLKMAMQECGKLLDKETKTRILDEIGESELKELSDEQIMKKKGDVLINVGEELFDVLKNHAAFSIIKIRPPYDPLTVFESLNSSRMQLAPSDLIKTILLQKSRDSSKEQVSDDWDDLVKKSEGSIVQFLRSWHTANQGFVRKKELYSAFKKSITTHNKVQNLLRELSSDVNWYNAIVSDSSLPERKSDELKNTLHRHANLNFRQGVPILLAFAKSGDRKAMQTAVEILSILYVRLFVTLSIRGSVVESSIDDICEAIRSDSQEGLKLLKQEADKLIKSYCPVIDWSSLQVSNSNVQKYLLTEMWVQISPNILEFPPNDTRLHVEHILPKKPKPNTYQEFNKVEMDYHKNHIGNLTLLLRKDNLYLSNKDFSTKKVIYELYDPDLPDGSRKSRGDYLNIELTSRISKRDTWNKDNIRKQAEFYSEIANKRWNLDRIDS
jgi:hypothetical protein